MAGESRGDGVVITAPERRVERGSGCWNCIHFEQGEPVLREWLPELERFIAMIKLSGSIQFPEYEQAADALTLSKLIGRGMPESRAVIELAKHKLVVARRMLHPALADVWDADKRIRDRKALTLAIEGGKLGMCRGGGTDREGNPVGKYIQCEHLCSKWSGRDGASLARAGHGPDKLTDELIADAEDIAAKRS